MAMPAGLVMKLPADLPESIVGHISHLLQRLLKVRFRLLHLQRHRVHRANVLTCESRRPSSTGHKSAIDLLCTCMQVSPQLQLIVCGEEPLKLQRVSCAEVQLPSLPYEAAMQLLTAANPKVACSTCLFQ